MASRYQASSRDAKRLAEEVSRLISREGTLFEGSNSEGVLFIIDRSEDPVTPLLNKWTYEAMVCFYYPFVVDFGVILIIFVMKF